ncbi:MAG: hypothetical protein JWL87_575 [Candidatus Adlerbacteria bacterium]|nr:hypothetical protein [Candidatus Adlerbacteria bacterium]
MLNLFPELLYPFFAPTLLRMGAAAAFIAIAIWQWKHQDAISQIELPFIGRQSWWVWFSLVVHLLVAAALLVGYATQVAAGVGALLALKQAFWSKQYPLLFPLGRAAGLLLILICISLIVSGAGAMAQDLPL